MIRVLAIITFVFLAACSRGTQLNPTPMPNRDQLIAELLDENYPSNSGGAGAINIVEYPGWQRFGYWYVKKVGDDMDPSAAVKLFTSFNASPSTDAATQVLMKNESFGIMIFGKSLAILAPGTSRKEGWPYCSNNSSSVRVDGAKAVLISTVLNRGFCNSIDMNGQVIKSFLSGHSAKVRVSYYDGYISLEGFKEAWLKAIQLGQ